MLKTISVAGLAVLVKVGNKEQNGKKIQIENQDRSEKNHHKKVVKTNQKAKKRLI